MEKGGNLYNIDGSTVTIGRAVANSSGNGLRSFGTSLYYFRDTDIGRLNSDAYDDDYWNGCLLFQLNFSPTTTGGQVRQITDSSSSGGTTTLTVDSNWDLLPISGRFSVSGKQDLVIFLLDLEY